MMDFQKSLFEDEEFAKAQNVRLIDKDGFTLPAPGGIKGKVWNREKTSDGEDNSLSLFDNNSHQIDNVSDVQVDSEREEFDGQPDVTDVPSDKGAAQPDVYCQPESYTIDNVTDIMRGFIHETNELQNEWSKIFSQSEEFEEECLQRLDVFSVKANALELERERQKNSLCHRIRGIGGILQNFE